MSSQPLTLQQIYDLCYQALRNCGASELQAEAVAQELMDAEAEGIRNVGLGYIHLYLNHLRCDKVVGNAQPEIVKESASATIVNANHGFCHTAYLHAEERLIETTREQGISRVGSSFELFRSPSSMKSLKVSGDETH
uniref:Lactate dehydrogenase n=1 Tax=uncultured Thiotrichaceae bacterium TaxID=298394 RepID=A0A6S6UBK5_9GAMM|nr:MAG: Lactate dehydrogenase [uncultured Thiotrichaceae bacterium]